jgi:hypothetical protein
MASTADDSRPIWASPLPPIVILAVGLTLLGLEGVSPYRTWWRLRNWVKARATLLESYERQQDFRMTPEGSSPEQLMERRPMQRVFDRTVERGWPVKRKVRVFEVRISYSYLWKGKRYTRVGDVAPVDFSGMREAEQWVSRRIEKGGIAIWVNPSEPSEASAFLDHQGFRWVRLGLTLAGVAVIWLILVAARVAARRKVEADRAAEEKRLTEERAKREAAREARRRRPT